MADKPTVTLEHLEQGVADEKVVDMLKTALEDRREAWRMEQEAKKAKEGAESTLKIALELLDVSSVKDKVYGTVTLYDKTRSSLSNTKLREVLLEKGVSAEVVASAWEAATIKPEKPVMGIRYTAPRRGK